MRFPSIKNTLKGAGSELSYLAHGATTLGKAFVRNATGGDIKPLMKSWGIKGYKKGGKVKKTGLALLHKGERVLTKKQQEKYGAMKQH